MINALLTNTEIDSNSCKKVFIIVCSHEAVDGPGQKTILDENRKEASGMNISIKVGSVRQCTDKKGRIAIADPIQTHFNRKASTKI